MNTLPAPLNIHLDATLVKLARELAIDHYDIETILKRHQITDEAWEGIKATPRFTQLLTSEIEAWQSALNTNERVKLKAAAVIEEWLEEATTSLHNKNETLPAKTEVAKLVARLAGMGISNIGVEGGSGDRFSVTINLGSDQKLTFEKQLQAPFIEADPPTE